ncbi:carotenoid oxygenase family protein [Marinicaulis aureus]|uniref:Dioxygenase n=1 Tax=Hyphococcus aureus TaxID=2666033 RepID=A0ABW1KXT8_9PROT
MGIVFSDNPLFENWGRPLRLESNIIGLELVSGELPDTLSGCWFRAGPDWQYPSGRDDDIFIDGEGMVHRFKFENGGVSYRSRWVRTARFQAQEKAGRALFGKYRNRYTSDPSVAHISMGAANTNAIFHDGKLFALKEDDLPYELDPDTLETLGRYDHKGVVKSVCMSAHPKIDTVEDKLLTYAYQAKGDATNDIVYYEFNGDGALDNEIWFEMPFPGMVHDFSVTPHYAIFPIFPMITDLERIKQGGDFYAYYPDENMHVAIVPRRGTAKDVKWFKGPAWSAGHMLNAFEKDDCVNLDLCLYEGSCFTFLKTDKGEPTAFCPPILSRLTFNMKQHGDEFARRPIMPVPCEMPRTDDRYQGYPISHGFVIAYRGQDGTSALGKVDMSTGEMKVWSPGPRSSIHEPQFVPRAPDSPEGDGWLLVIVNRLDENHSDLAIVDANDIEAGPVALFSLPMRVRSTFHGTWVPAETIATGHHAMRRML